MSLSENKQDFIDELKVILAPKKDNPETDPKKAADAVAIKLGNAIYDNITSAKIETSVTVDLSGQTFNTTTFGPAIAIPGSIASGDGIGEIKWRVNSLILNYNKQNNI